ncbi:MAG: S8 family serine peptidase [Actinobacteria bacterium]|nr:S8 family serine peptidase [Actinomycetota bacterium]MBV8598129.1 S8 family serine peptidase [Actinomycetota bacterium]
MRALALVALAVLLGAGPAAAFDSTDPLVAKQWYLAADKAWSYWATQPPLATVKVAIVDSGIDYRHPEFAGRIAGGESFVGGSWQHDSDGHGTFVAGEIAADPGNGLGIAGLAFNAQLLVAKVVKPDGSVSLQGEIDAIRWAVDNGARVINLSLGGVRDPEDPQLDTYSALEQGAVQYAYAHGAVVVAAVGNGEESPSTPWRYADYPAALPHVIGVGAYGRTGNVPTFSNRDAAYVDLVAPGTAIFSTVPRNLLDTKSGPCPDGPYSDCGPYEFRNAIGTSFAAPQVSAAAALLLGVDPSLRPDQVAWLLERTARDATPATGCSLCTRGRDAFSGWGYLDVAAAVTALEKGVLPPADAHEPNDNAGTWAIHFGPPRTITATLDYWDDQVDVYSIALRQGERIFVRLSPLQAAQTTVVLWKPGTQDVNGSHPPLRNEAARALAVGSQQRIAYTAPVYGTYYIEVKLLHGTYMPVQYHLAVATRQTGV